MVKTKKNIQKTKPVGENDRIPPFSRKKSRLPYTLKMFKRRKRHGRDHTKQKTNLTLVVLPQLGRRKHKKGPLVNNNNQIINIDNNDIEIKKKETSSNIKTCCQVKKQPNKMIRMIMISKIMNSIDKIYTIPV